MWVLRRVVNEAPSLGPEGSKIVGIVGVPRNGFDRSRKDDEELFLGVLVSLVGCNRGVQNRCMAAQIFRGRCRAVINVVLLPPVSSSPASGISSDSIQFGSVGRSPG